jgi:hypothetical protein
VPLDDARDDGKTDAGAAETGRIVQPLECLK